jgi:hypothetical protein
MTLPARSRGEGNFLGREGVIECSPSVPGLNFAILQIQAAMSGF